MIKNNKLEEYGKNFGLNTYIVSIIPTVLSELDELKVKGQDLTFKNKVKKRINQIKGYRKQGNLLDGVTIHRTIIVKMYATEPKFEKTLNWLSPDNKDDRIIASALEIQLKNPSYIVILITSDINLQNKAEMAKLPYIETP